MYRLTNFFFAQRYYIRMSWLFYGLLLLVVCVQFALLLLLTAMLTYVLTGQVGISLMMWAMAALAIYLLLGMLIAQQKIKQGGISVAKRAKAVRLFVHASDEQAVFTPSFIRVATPKEFPQSYQRYYEFAEQLAIASGVPLPKLYVLPFEQGVNGFVAGFDASDRVMVLTQGAVDKLSNAELYGLLGHEFGHIIHGDARLNLKIYVMLTMLGWIYDFIDVLQDWIFGKFDKDYHQQFTPFLSAKQSVLPTPLGQDKQAWISYLKQERDDFGRKMLFGQVKNNIQDNEVYLLFAYLMSALLLVGLRLFGVVGMVSAEWIKQQFNHQREFLADATSVQLTRSYDVVEALKSLQKHHQTSLHNPIFGTSMGHFFFADPKTSDALLHSHPDIEQRLDMVYAQEYQDFGKQMTATLDVQKLQTAHQFIQNYQLPNEVAASQPQPPTISEKDSIEFWAEPEVVVGGRLLTQHWQRFVDKQIIYPKNAKQHSSIDNTFDSKTEHLSVEFIKTINLPWYISRALSKLPSTLALIEVVLLCRYQTAIELGVAINLPTIYHVHKSSKAKPPSHKLPSVLLTEVVRFDRRLDGLLMMIALRRLRQLCQDQSQLSLLINYQNDLAWLLTTETPINTKISQLKQLSFDHQMIVNGNYPASLDTLYQGALMATLWRLIGGQISVVQTNRQALLAWLLNDYSNQSIACVWLLLIFLASIQDNSLHLCRYDKLVATIRRWCQVLGLAIDLDDQTIIKLMYQLRVLDVMDWWVLLLGIDDKQQVLLEGITTAMIYNGNLAQAEYDLLGVLSVLWNQQIPKI